ncbi:hypothetical protein BVC80_8939g36 [Macleaya cordata]|uniref:Reverse transcriptase zinc-binding domain n=1 Tax=Macleaya cordata TaxID=56857 RepID=A0A200R863_MACCD|nr:hypothetical protein BVC80_8939g36 [Macleaya cordata]
MESFGFSWCFPENTKDLLWAWNGCKFSKGGRKLWRLIPHAICWVLWKQRNEIIFDSKQSSFHERLIRIKGMLFLWGKGLNCLSNFRFEDFVVRWETVVQAL